VAERVLAAVLGSEGGWIGLALGRALLRRIDRRLHLGGVELLRHLVDAPNESVLVMWAVPVLGREPGWVRLLRARALGGRGRAVRRILARPFRDALAECVRLARIRAERGLEHGRRHRRAHGRALLLRGGGVGR